MPIFQEIILNTQN